MKFLLSYINDHPLMKIISQEYSIEEHDSIIGQIIMVLILQMLNVLTQEFNVRTEKFWTLIEAAFKQIDTSGIEF